MSEPPSITSAHRPDLDEVRAWFEKMIKSPRFVELVAAIIALITRMAGINSELMKRWRICARSDRARRRSGDSSDNWHLCSPAWSSEEPRQTRRPTRMNRRLQSRSEVARVAILAELPCPSTSSACRSSILCRRPCASVPSAARRWRRSLITCERCSWSSGTTPSTKRSPDTSPLSGMGGGATQLLREMDVRRSRRR
jgi:hypothetical protein